MAKNDRVRVIVDVGSGQVERQDFVADAAGRSVTFSRKKDVIEVEVAGRAGGTVRRAEFRADRVLMIEEIPA